MLVTSLGGTTWEWASTETYFTRRDRRRRARSASCSSSAARPSRCSRSSCGASAVFRVGGVLSAIVGFALFGSVTFLPLYFQTVDAASPSESGLRMIPMMAGILITSIASGQAIARLGRYKVFPVAGTAVMAVGLLLLSRLGVGTSTALASLYLFVLGAGLGLVMQVLVLAVQNSVPYETLGTATSGVTLLRGVGGSLGTAAFGAIFTNKLVDGLGQRARCRRSSSRCSAAAGGSPATRSSGCRSSPASPTSRPTSTRSPPSSSPPRASRRSASCSAGACPSSRCARRRRRAAGWRTASPPRAARDSLAELDRQLSLATTREARMEFHEKVGRRVGRRPQPGRDLGARPDRLARHGGRAGDGAGARRAAGADRRRRAPSCASAGWSRTPRARRSRRRRGGR